MSMFCVMYSAIDNDETVLIRYYETQICVRVVSSISTLVCPAEGDTDPDCGPNLVITLSR